MAADYTAALGIGKLITSVTMTVFYVLLYYVWLRRYGKQEDRRLTAAVWIPALIRIILCFLPQNGWLENRSDAVWGIICNVPFVILGGIICICFRKTRASDPLFRYVWLYILLSFLFYIPVAVAASLVPLLGMLMLPKTVCYMLLIWCFRKYAFSAQA